MGKLTATAVKAAKAAGRYGDGDGLFLLVGKTGARSWVCRVQKDGKRRDIGLGSALYKPAMTAAVVGLRAAQFVAAVRQQQAQPVKER